MTHGDPRALVAFHRRVMEEDIKQCPEERDGTQCLMNLGHGYNHNNGRTSWGHPHAFVDAACGGCGSDLLPVGDGFICCGCGRDSAVKTAVACNCGKTNFVIVRPDQYACPGCDRTIERSPGK